MQHANRSRPQNIGSNRVTPDHLQMVSGGCDDIFEGDSDGLRTKVGIQIDISIPERIQSNFQFHDWRRSCDNINSTKEI
jgi:hypothetical protein